MRAAQPPHRRADLAPHARRRSRGRRVGRGAVAFAITHSLYKRSPEPVDGRRAPCYPCATQFTAMQLAFSMPHRLLKFGFCADAIPNRACSAQPERLKDRLRRGDHRRRRARPRRRLLPCARSRHPQRRRAREGLPRRRQHGRNTTIIRSNYLTPEGVRFYDESVQLWQDLSRTSTSTFSIPRAATSRWRTPMPTCARCAGAPRSTSTSACDSESWTPAFVKRRVPMMDLDLRRACADPRRAVSRAGRHRAARRRGLGLWPRRGPPRRGDPPAHRGPGHRRAATARSPACAPTRGNIATRSVLCAVAGYTPRMLQHGGARPAASTCIRCRPWCPSRSSPGSIRSSCPARCTCTCRRPRAANS